MHVVFHAIDANGFAVMIQQVPSHVLVERRLNRGFDERLSLIGTPNEMHVELTECFHGNKSVLAKGGIKGKILRMIWFFSRRLRYSQPDRLRRIGPLVQ